MSEKMIAIKRSQSSAEGMKTHFQTTRLIVNHLKRKSDLHLIEELITSQKDLKNLISASCSVHCYHDLGVRTKNENQMVTNVFNISNFEKIQKKELFQEIYQFIGSAIADEISLLLKTIDFEEKLLENIDIETLDWNQKYIDELKTQIQIHLIEVLNQYPEVFWIDHVGDMTGLTHQIKNDILRESGELKATSVELEERILTEKYSDKTIELSTYKKLSKQFQRDFEYNTINDLKVKTFPFRKIISKILKYKLDLFPISKRGITYFKEAAKLKKYIIHEFQIANEKLTEYPQLEEKIQLHIKETLIHIAKKGPNQFIYFLKNILEQYFEDIYALLNRLGISNLSNFCDALKIDYRSFYKDCRLNDIDKFTFKNLGTQNNPIYKIVNELNQYQVDNYVIFGGNLQSILNSKDPRAIRILRELCQKYKTTPEDLDTLLKKQYIIENLYRKKYPIKGSIANYALIYELPSILDNLSNQIFFMFFQKITRQVARLLECYLKLNKDKDITLFGLKRIAKSSDQSWIDVKIEELVIQRLMGRQEELATIFNAKNKAFLVNGFIMARFFDSSIKEGIKILKSEPSSIYQPFVDLPLPMDLISPKSYVIAFDIFNRLHNQRETLALEKAQNKEQKQEKRNEQIKKVQKIRDLNTLNWIERKITSTLVSVTAISNNPTNLYWSDKDQTKVVEDIFQHSQLKNRKICSQCGKDNSSNSCETRLNKTINATPLDLFAQYLSFAYEDIEKNFSIMNAPDFSKVLQKVETWMNEAVQERLQRNITGDESRKLIDGEIRFIAIKIAQTIGKRLDKAIYKKFKSNLRNR